MQPGLIPGLIIALLTTSCATGGGTHQDPYPYPENPWPTSSAPLLNSVIQQAKTERITFYSPPIDAQQVEPTLTVLRFLSARKISYGQGPLQKNTFTETLSPGLAKAFTQDAADTLDGYRIYEGPITAYLTNLQLRGNKAILFTCEDHTQYGVNNSRNETEPWKVERNRETTEFGKNESYEFRLLQEENIWKIVQISRIAFPRSCPPPQ